MIFLFKGPGRIALVLGGHSIFQLIPVRSNRKDPYSPKIGFLVHVPCVCWSCCVSLCFIWRVSAFFRWLNFGVRFFWHIGQKRPGFSRQFRSTSGSLGKPFCVVATWQAIENAHCRCYHCFHPTSAMLKKNHHFRESLSCRVWGCQKFPTGSASPKIGTQQPSIHRFQDQETFSSGTCTCGTWGKIWCQGHDQPTSKPPIPASVDLNCNGETWREETPQQISGDFSIQKHFRMSYENWGRVVKGWNKYTFVGGQKVWISPFEIRTIVCCEWVSHR